MNNNKWAIVTGASRGLGLAYTKELLKLGFNVVCVARNIDSLKTLEKEFLDQRIKLISLDLGFEENNKKLYEQVNVMDIELLINNVGMGKIGFIKDISLEESLKMINLNIKSTQILTQLFLNDFIAKNKGLIINIGSVIASYVPAPLFATYYATKSYVYSFSRALSYELKKSKSKVKVKIITPGVLNTEFISKENKGYDTNKFASKSLKIALNKKNDHIVIGFKNKLSICFVKYLNEKKNMKSIYNFQNRRL